MCVLIVPLWNWNDIILSESDFISDGFNCTFMELKYGIGFVCPCPIHTF